VKINFIGAAKTVTGSKTAVSAGNRTVLVDCGLFQGPKEIRMQNWNSFEGAKDLNSVILTHAHIDHSGYLPKLVREGFNGPIYSSPGTHDLCKIMLLDSGRLQEEDAGYANRTGYSNHKPALPLYTEADAAYTLLKFKSLERDQWHAINPGMNLRFLRSGHIIGSSFVQLAVQTEEGSKLITFSGDLGNGRSNTLKPPVTVSETDVLVLEATYGNRQQPRADPFPQMASLINRIYDRQGVLVIPAFTVGRTQELLFLIRQLEDANIIPKIPVYLDSPMAIDATEIYLRHTEDHQLVFRNGLVESPVSTSSYKPVRSADESMLLCMKEGPMIVISAAGMLTGGRIMHHLKHRLPDKRNAVLFVGYQAEGTKGRLLQEGVLDIRIHHQTIPVEAEICSLESISAHADAEDTIRWLRGLRRPPETIFLNHGETDALEALKKKIETEFGYNVVIPSPGDLYNMHIHDKAPIGRIVIP
jgi:metallo-beta-lactamase family protein